VDILLYLLGGIVVFLLLAFALHVVIAFLTGLVEYFMKVALVLAIIGFIYLIGGGILHLLM
jgi:hypothetical protein